MSHLPLHSISSGVLIHYRHTSAEVWGFGPMRGAREQCTIPVVCVHLGSSDMQEKVCIIIQEQNMTTGDNV